LSRSSTAAPPALGFWSAGRTDIGPCREVNEDAFLIRDDLAPGVGLWAVADGMGGHQAGDVASKMVVDTLTELEPPASGHEFLLEVEGALQGANAAMLYLAGEIGPAAVVGSTVVALLAFGGHYACLWAGDSRAYLLRDGRLTQLTRDDSVVQTLLDGGLISQAQARVHRQANVLTRALGARTDLQLSLSEGPMLAGDVYLLCTDGLSNMLDEQDLARALAEPDTAAEALVAQALAQGATDNLTALVVASR
jgi:serine/threonine protein phosphatase PrpC